jgi:transcription-repair coupling factor (superfamily II helicase)
MVISFRANAFRNPAGLVAWLGSKAGQIRLRPDHKLAIAREMTIAQRVRLARDVVEKLNQIAAQAKAA